MLILCVLVPRQNYGRSAVVVVRCVKGTFRFKVLRQIYIPVYSYLYLSISWLLKSRSKCQFPHAFCTIAWHSSTLFQQTCIGKFSMQVTITLFTRVHLPFMADTWNYPRETFRSTYHCTSTQSFRVSSWILWQCSLFRTYIYLLYTLQSICFQAVAKCYHHFIMSIHCSC